jgi:hypothetical protein
VKKDISYFNALCKPLLVLKGVEKSTSYGTPALKVKGKLLVRLDVDNSRLVIKIQPAYREILLRDKPDIYFVTDHYVNYPYVLCRLNEIHPDEFFELLKKECLLPARK